MGCKDCTNGCGSSCKTVITKQGERGLQGPVGPPGRAGVNGTNGVQGQTGATGIAGVPGTTFVAFSAVSPRTSVLPNGDVISGLDANGFSDNFTVEVDRQGFNDNISITISNLPDPSFTFQIASGIPGPTTVGAVNILEGDSKAHTGIFRFSWTPGTLPAGNHTVDVTFTPVLVNDPAVPAPKMYTLNIVTT